MESLRWILLVAGAIFVLVIYIFGKKRRQRNDMYVDDADYDMPAFSARSLDDVDEGVGEVKVIVNGGPAADEADPLMDMSRDSESDNDHYDRQADADVSIQDGDDNAVQQETKTDNAKKPEVPMGIIVLYILPKIGEKLMGAHINSSAQALGLKFGEMNIFHYKPGGRIVFSLANMVEPGSFDPDSMHDLQTSGVTVFMQISGNDPLDDLTEMLQRSYQLAGLLDARLCNHYRKPLTEQDAENYRNKVREFTNRQQAAPVDET
jgi:cell division protein ZipA